MSKQVTTSAPGRWQTWQPWLSLLVRVGLAGVALWSGIAKAMDFDQSARAVLAYDIFNWDISKLIGYALPVGEIIIGLLLLAGLMTRWASLLFGLLMVAFIVGISQAWARGLSIDCGCFGGGGFAEVNWQDYLLEILRDVGLAALAAGLMIWPWSKFSADHALDIEPSRRNADAA